MYRKTGAEKRAELGGSRTEREDFSFRRREEKRAAEQKRKEGIEERGRRGSIPAGFSAGVNPARVQDSVQSC